MSELAITREGDVLRLAGALRLAGIVSALEQLRHELSQGAVSVLDLAGVTSSDSSAVALILEMRRLGVARVRHIPAEMAAIVRACQLEPLLQTDPSPALGDGQANHDKHS